LCSDSLVDITKGNLVHGQSLIAFGHAGTLKHCSNCDERSHRVAVCDPGDLSSAGVFGHCPSHDGTHRSVFAWACAVSSAARSAAWTPGIFHTFRRCLSEHPSAHRRTVVWSGVVDAVSASQRSGAVADDGAAYAAPHGRRGSRGVGASPHAGRPALASGRTARAKRPLDRVPAAADPLGHTDDDRIRGTSSLGPT